MSEGVTGGVRAWGLEPLSRMHLFAQPNASHSTFTHFSHSVFASHLLNRDVFKDELVSSIIADGFIFWQAQYTVRCERDASATRR